jgi:hypothetical protein
MSTGSRYTGLIEHYRDRLPVSDDTRIISIGEGNTPLVRLENIPREIGKDIDLYIKYEGLNPTGSFKDRGMTMAVAVRLDRQYLGRRRGLCRARRYDRVRDYPGGHDCARQAGAGDDPRGGGHPDTRQLR